MICPKCGFEQPDGVECMRCGVIISRYKGPVVGAAEPRNTPPAFAPPPPFIPPPPVIAGGAVHAPIPPPPSISPAGGTVFGDTPTDPAGGTVYSGPPPPPAGSGAVYSGQGSSGPAFSAFPAFHGTFETGALVKEVFSIYFSNIIPFLLLSTLALSPVLVYSAWASSLPVLDPKAVIARSLVSLLQVLCAPVATAAITYGVYQQMRGANTSIGDCLKVGLTTLFPLLGLAIVQGFGVGCAFFACIVPGIILAVRWAVAVPAKVEERVSVGDALSRSTYLTDGYRWQVFGVLAVMGVISFVMTMVLIAIFAGKTQSGAFLFTGSLLQVATTGLTATASAVMYYRLRSVKESIDVDQISSVFA
jgi:hypothetical protein